MAERRARRWTSSAAQVSGHQKGSLTTSPSPAVGYSYSSATTRSVSEAYETSWAGKELNTQKSRVASLLKIVQDKDADFRLNYLLRASLFSLSSDGHAPKNSASFCQKDDIQS